jgi:hypothetical protein
MVIPLPTSLSFSALEHDKWHLMSARSHTIPFVGSIKLAVGKPLAKCKTITSLLQNAQNQNDEVGDQGLIEPPQITSQEHKHKKGVKKNLTLDQANEKDPKNVEKDSKEEEDYIGTSSRRLEIDHLNDQTVDRPLKKKNMKSNNLLVAQRKSISTKIQATDAKT